MDTKLFDVKLSELPAWFARREKTPGAFYNEFMRNIWRVHHKYYSGPVYANTVSFMSLLISEGQVTWSFLFQVKTIFRFIFAYSFLNWLVKSHRYLDVQKTMYHW